MTGINGPSFQGIEPLMYGGDGDGGDCSGGCGVGGEEEEEEEREEGRK